MRMVMLNRLLLASMLFLAMADAHCMGVDEQSTSTLIERARRDAARLSTDLKDRPDSEHARALKVSDRFATAISAAFRQRGPVRSQEYVLNDGRRATRLAGPLGAYCVSTLPVWSVLADPSRGGHADRLVRIACPSNDLPDQ